MMPVKAYLADLRYNYSGVLANDCMPLGIAYMKAVMDRDEPQIQSRLFVYPDRLLDALKSDPPDVLMVTNYVWNEALSLHFGRLAKRIKPGTLVVMGGPNISLEPSRQIAWVERHPEIDLYVIGEGDFLACEVLRHFLDAGKDVRRMGAREIPSSVYRNPEGQVVRTGAWARHKEVDDIPSAWLTGIQDEFFDGRLAPMIETNRGCPFTCTFCVQGTSWYTKVHNFDKDRMREELFYIARRIKARSPNMGTLRIADSNYGMFERDIEISGYIGECQRQFGWPTFIDATTGKNRPDRIVKSLEQVSGALVLYQAVQSLDEEVLRKVKRQTIKLEAYEQLQVEMRGRGLRSNSDLILGLPGETLQTHLAALHRLLDGGIDQLHNFQAMLLKGSEMETEESRRTFKFDSRFRVLPKNFGVSEGGEKVFDIEEIIVGTDTLPFSDYLTARQWHLTSSVFWNDSWFDVAVQFAGKFGIRPSQWWSAMLPAMENGSPAMRKFLGDFVHETIHELFPTREACHAFYSQDENFRRLEAGEIGDNLMYKYRAIASFHLWNEVCAAAMDATRRLLEERGADREMPGFAEFWEDFTTYVRHRHAHGQAAEQILGAVPATLRYDIPAWLAAGQPVDPSAFRRSEPVEFEFRLSDEGRRELGAALQVWGANTKGQTKMVTRIKVAWQVRECHALQPQAAAVAAD
jgi:radical SAM superfamily enzyme YgiQ (UPF0313 family)